MPGVDRTAQPRLTADDLASLLEWLGDRFSFLTPKEFLAGDRAGVLLTFDDGFANNAVQALPVLRKFECPALFFVSTQHVVNPRDWLGFVREQVSRAWEGPAAVPEEIRVDWYDGMSEERLRECAASPLITIGSHGVGHRVLTECEDHELAQELRDSKSYLEGVTGQGVDYFAYPKGLYDARVMREVGSAGYEAAFTIDSLGLGSPNLELPRIGIYRVDRNYLSLKLSGLHRRPLWCET
ncbi:MAG: polysaccharide deacetylase family protein [Thermoleophilia bacterium]|nr:polysaccharide deacetylase family protein [Thermoleophilia bacterium]